MGKLTDAVRNYNLPEINRLLAGEYKGSPSINEVTDSDNYEAETVTPLYIAAQNDYVDGIECLLKAGAKIDQGNNHGKTPLFVAVSCKCFDAVKCLLNAGSNVNQANKDGETPFHRAVTIFDDVDVIERFLKAGAKLNLGDKDGRTPLDRAAMGDDVAVIECLLKAGANVNQTDKKGQTPLHTAAQQDKVAAIERLLKAGAKVDQADNNGMTPLHLAALSDAPKAIEFLLKGGANVNHASNRRETPLCIAAALGKFQAIEFLLKAGANVNQADNDGMTPLFYIATEYDYADEAVEWLLKAGAKVDQAAKDGRTPLYAAAQEGYADIVECLLKAGAEINKQTSKGTPLSIAKEKGQSAVVTLLEKHQRLRQEKLTQLKKQVEETRKLLTTYRQSVTVDSQYVTQSEKFLDETLAYYQANSGMVETPEFKDTTTSLNGMNSFLQSAAPKSVAGPSNRISLPSAVASSSQTSSSSVSTNTSSYPKLVINTDTPMGKALKAEQDHIEKEKATANPKCNLDILQASQQLQISLQQELIQEKKRFEALEKEQAQLKQRQEALSKSLTGKTNNADLASIIQRLEDVEVQTAILMNEYEIKAKKREALQRFHSHSNLLLFYRTVHIKLEDIFISMKAVSGGFVDPTQGDYGVAQSIVEGLGGVASLVPVIGSGLQTVLKWTGQALGKADSLKQNNIANNASALVTISEVKKYAESAARQLTESYAEQLLLLATLDDEQNAANRLEKGIQKAKEAALQQMVIPPAKQLASFAVLWMADVIYHSKGIAQSDLDTVLLAQVTQKGPSEGVEKFWNSISMKIGLQGLRTSKGIFWKPADVLTLPGVKVRTQANQFQFYSGGKLKPAEFGWRLDTVENAHLLKLQLVPNPNNTTNGVEPAKETATLKKVLAHQAADLDDIKKRQERHDKGVNIIGGARMQELEKQNQSLVQELANAKEREQQMEARMAALEAKFATMQVGQSNTRSNLSQPSFSNNTFLPSQSGASSSRSNTSSVSSASQSANTNASIFPSRTQYGIAKK